METTNRVAVAGEQILIVDASYTGGYYANGNVLTVAYREDDGVRVVEHHAWISDDEYEVFAAPCQCHNDLLEEIEELKARVAELEGGR